MCSLPLFLLVLLLLTTLTSAISQGIFPLSKSFGPEIRCRHSTISCPPNSVILPRSVILLTTSEKIKCKSEQVENEIDLDEVQCENDITLEVEEKCFGNFECSLDTDWKLNENDSCNFRNGFGFFNISYDCLTIEHTSCFDCETQAQYARIRSSNGYLSSLMAAHERISHQCGTSRCPWLLQTPPGQNINLTFIQPGELNKERSKSSDSSCSNVVFSTKEDAIFKDVKTCSGSERVSHIHTSVSNSVSMFFNDEQLSSIGGHYLVYYEVLGCEDIIPPKFSRMRRSHDKVVIDCPETPNSVWTIHCRENKWMGLESIEECPATSIYVKAQQEAMRAEEKSTLLGTTLFNMPVGIMLTLVVACAVVLGVLILTMGMVCLKRHNYDLKHKDDPNIYGAACSEFEFKEMGGGLMTAQKFAYQQHLLAQADRQRRASGDMLARDNTYAMQDLVRMDTRPLPSLPNNSSPSTTFSRQAGPVPYGVYPQARVAVQFHRADSDVMASGYPGHQFMNNQFHGHQYPGPPRGYMTTRPATQFRNPYNPRMPQQATMGRQDDNHLYFVLDGNAPDEKVGTLPPPPSHLLPPTSMPPNTTMPQPPHNRSTPNTGAAM